jgi:hypothetical protein
MSEKRMGTFKPLIAAGEVGGLECTRSGGIGSNESWNEGMELIQGNRWRERQR